MSKDRINELVDSLETVELKIKDSETQTHLLKGIKAMLLNELDLASSNWTEEELMRPVL